MLFSYQIERAIVAFRTLLIELSHKLAVTVSSSLRVFLFVSKSNNRFQKKHQNSHNPLVGKIWPAKWHIRNPRMSQAWNTHNRWPSNTKVLPNLDKGIELHLDSYLKYYFFEHLQVFVCVAFNSNLFVYAPFDRNGGHIHITITTNRVDHSLSKTNCCLKLLSKIVQYHKIERISQ